MYITQKKTVYETFDGQHFGNKDDADDHNHRLGLEHLLEGIFWRSGNYCYPAELLPYLVFHRDKILKALTELKAEEAKL